MTGKNKSKENKERKNNFANEHSCFKIRYS